MPAKEKRRLPPGQFITREFPVSHVGSIPPFHPATWDLSVFGLVEIPVRIDHDQFLALPRREVVTDLHCVTTWSTMDLRFEGVPFSRIVGPAHPLPTAKYVLIHAESGYTTNLPIEDLMAEDVIIADRLNGEELTPEHGFPARLVVPHKYRYKSAKWIRRIEFLAEDHPGFWETRGYSNSADPWTEDRFAK